MVNLDAIPLILAHKSNFSGVERHESSIKYIVMHYTANIGDTASNNCKYFANTVTKSSAHYFVNDSTIMQSVPCEYPAYSVGLGLMKKPYIANPSHYKKCKNTNSISIEMCGSRTSREATEETKHTAAELAAALMREYDIPIDNVIRHYDVTGKQCPAWAVDSAEWTRLKSLIMQYYLMGDDEMRNTQENYNVFKQFMEKYKAELAAEPATWEADVMSWAQSLGLINDGAPKAFITRGEFATVMRRVYEQFGR